MSGKESIELFDVFSENDPILYLSAHFRIYESVRGSLFVTLCVSIGLKVGFASVKTSPKTTSVVLSVDPLPEPKHLF